jgi:hypothetical protein
MSGPQSLLTGGIAGLAIGAGITAAIMAATSTGNDVFSAGGYGKRTLLAPEGAFRLNDNDNIIATTNPIEANDLMSRPKGAINVAPKQQANQQSNISIAPSNTQISINLDSAALGNATARSDYSIGKGRYDYSASV